MLEFLNRCCICTVVAPCREELEEICIRCNTKKWNAKKASDASNLVFFSYYLKTLLVRTPEKPYLGVCLAVSGASKCPGPIVDDLVVCPS